MASASTLSTINLPVWLAWISEEALIFTSHPWACAVTLSDNRLLDLQEPLYGIQSPNWSRRAHSLNPVVFSVLRKRGNEKIVLSGSPHQTHCLSLLTLKAFNVNQFTRHLDSATICQRWDALAQKPRQMDSPLHSIRGKQRGSVSWGLPPERVFALLSHCWGGE